MPIMMERIWIRRQRTSNFQNNFKKKLQRSKYNEAKDEPTYRLFGPPGEGDTPIPIMAGWDDHDFAGNERKEDGNGKMIITDADADYPCKNESQVI